MIKNRFFATLLLTAILMSVTAFDCNDSALAPVPSLPGEYDGSYTLKLNYGEADESIDVYAISWEFSDERYWMYVTEDSSGICAPDGEYEVTWKALTLTELDDGCGGTMPIPTYNPEGFFSMKWEGNELTMTQQIADTLKTIRIVKRT